MIKNIFSPYIAFYKWYFSTHYDRDLKIRPIVYYFNNTYDEYWRCRTDSFDVFIFFLFALTFPFVAFYFYVLLPLAPVFVTVLFFLTAFAFVNAILAGSLFSILYGLLLLFATSVLIIFVVAYNLEKKENENEQAPPPNDHGINFPTNYH